MNRHSHFAPKETGQVIRRVVHGPRDLGECQRESEPGREKAVRRFGALAVNPGSDRGSSPGSLPADAVSAGKDCVEQSQRCLLRRERTRQAAPKHLPQSVMKEEIARLTGAVTEVEGCLRSVAHIGLVP
jgi:hypothetical protein